MFKITSAIYAKLCFALLCIFVCSCAPSSQTEDEKQEKNFDKEVGFDYGQVKDGKYTNSYFGFELEIPKDWVVQSKEQTQELEKMGKDILAGEDETMQAIIKASEVNSATLLQVFQYEVGSPVDYNPNFTMAIENTKAFPGIKSGSDYLVSARKMIKQTPMEFEHIDEEFTSKTFSGQEFYLMNVTMKYSGNSIYQKYYATLLKDFAITMVVSYNTPEQEKEVDSIVNSLKFEK